MKTAYTNIIDCTNLNQLTMKMAGHGEGKNKNGHMNPGHKKIRNNFVVELSTLKLQLVC